jgi:hypothetical protein
MESNTMTATPSSNNTNNNNNSNGPVDSTALPSKEISEENSGWKDEEFLHSDSKYPLLYMQYFPHSNSINSAFQSDSRRRFSSERCSAVPKVSCEWLPIY